MNIKKYVLSVLLVGSLASLVLVPVLASAQANPGVREGRGFGKQMGQRPGVFGTVTAVSGNIITVSQKKGNTVTVYTVDGTSATVTKAGQVSTISAIVVGDNVSVQGTVTGTSVVATKINDGKMMGKVGENKNNLVKNVVGNGQPVVAGTVSSVSGNIITITNKSNITYTVDATNAKVQGAGVTTVSGVSVGDSVVVQGTINGNSVVATLVVDQKSKPAGIFGGMMNWFKNLFGF